MDSKYQQFKAIGGKSFQTRSVVYFWKAPLIFFSSRFLSMADSQELENHNVTSPGMDLAALRQEIDLRFDDVGLDALCLDHFRPVYDRFGRGHRKDEKITLLLDYCRREPTKYQLLVDLFQMQASYGSKLSVAATKGKDFWQTLLDGVSLDANIYVVLSVKYGSEWVQGKPTQITAHTPLLSYNEVAAFFRLQHLLPQIKNRLVLVHGGIEDSQEKGINIPDFPEDETLIVIGSPHAHKLCQRIVTSPKISLLPFRFELNEKGKCINVYQDEKGEWSAHPFESFPDSTVGASFQENMPEEDYGIILRITNPMDASGQNKVLILGGNHGFGTESAINFVAEKERVKSLHDIVQEDDFEALFQASVGRKKGLRLGLRRLAVLRKGIWQPVAIV